MSEAFDGMGIARLPATSDGTGPRLPRMRADRLACSVAEGPGMTTDHAVAEISSEELDSLRRSCTRFLHWHGWRPPADYLAEIPHDPAPDVYGEGGVVAELEREVASILGKPAAVFVPSGTMAQQIALRVHADRRSRRTIL